MQFLLHLHVTCSCNSHAYVPSFQYKLLYLKLLWNFLIVFLFLPLFLFTLVMSLAPKRKSTLARNPLVPELLHPLIPLCLIFGSMMMMPSKHSRRTFLDQAFIRNAKSFYQTLLTPTFPLSFTVRDGSHCVTSQSPVLSCLSKSFTPTCTGLIVQYLFSSFAFEVRAFLSHRNLLWICFGSLG